MIVICKFLGAILSSISFPKLQITFRRKEEIIEGALLHCKYDFMVAQLIYFVLQGSKDPFFFFLHNLDRGLNFLPETSQNSSSPANPNDLCCLTFVFQMLSTWTWSPPSESSTTCSPTTKTLSELFQFHLLILLWTLPCACADIMHYSLDTGGDQLGLTVIIMWDLKRPRGSSLKKALNVSV